MSRSVQHKYDQTRRNGSNETMSVLSELIRKVARPLPRIMNPDFARDFDSFANSRIVLIGDSTHGTAEHYAARAAITQHLVENHGFNIVAVEADYPDAGSIDRYVRLRPKATYFKEPPFSRFPTWMWQNTHVHDFVLWLRDINVGLPKEKRTGFYGLDLYSLYTSIDAVVQYLDKVDPDAAKSARARYACLQPWIDNPQKYGLEAFVTGEAPCEDAVVGVLVELLKKRLDYTKLDGEDFLDAEQNARLIADSEQYYRAMYYGGAVTWNLRDTHMFETLERLLAFKGEGAKAVVWAHNSHVGDARFTSMGKDRKEINIGQLCRERWGNAVSIIGFGTHTGTVAAANQWDEPMQVMKVNPSRPDSYEYQFYKSGVERGWVDFRKKTGDPNLVQALLKPRLERFIGVVYRPDTEIWSHYSQAILPKQFDAYVWIEKTSAVKPLHKELIHHALAYDETYPFGL